MPWKLGFPELFEFLCIVWWDGHALNWFNHNESQSLPLERFVARGIADVKEEIALVASTLNVPPVVIAHSMGGMAVQKGRPALCSWFRI